MIQKEKFEIIGYIKKKCICDKCNCEMERGQFLSSLPPKYEMKCPKCGTVEYVNCEDLQDQFELKRKEIC